LQSGGDQRSCWRVAPYRKTTVRVRRPFRTIAAPCHRHGYCLPPVCGPATNFRTDVLRAYTGHKQTVRREQTLIPVTRSHTPLGVFCLTMWLGLLAVGLWPFNFFPGNQVSWLRDRNGVHFDRYGQVFSTAPLIVDPQHGTTGGEPELTIELWLTPRPQAYSLHPILCAGESENFAVVQSGFDLVLQGRFLDQDSRATSQRFFVDDVLQNNIARFLTLTSGLQGTVIYLEGVPAKTYSNFHLSTKNFGKRLLLGQAPAGVQAWTGDILGLAFYEQALSPWEVAADYDHWMQGETEQLKSAHALYVFDEREGEIVHNRAASAAPDLLIPTRFERFRPKILEFPRPFKKSDVEDTIVNIVGFIPFGFLLLLY